jgi:arsenate reductase-like glutaredoxin family protein
MMRLWVDDVRMPKDKIGGYIICKSVNAAKDWINHFGINSFEAIYLDHDAGDYAGDGGDYIKLLDWFEEAGMQPPIIHFLTANPVGRANMISICRKNGWRFE